jgi:hypothetical protein
MGIDRYKITIKDVKVTNKYCLACKKALLFQDVTFVNHRFEL